MGEVITRRRFLAGSGALAVAAGGGFVAATHPHGVRRFLHGHGVLDGPDQAIPETKADVEFGDFASTSVHHRVGYGLSRPDAEPTAALFCLHGRGGSHRDPFDDLGLHHFVAAAGLPWLVASVDGGESFWHPRADGTDAQRLVIDELMPRVLGDAPSSVQPVVMGWSMGGFGALLLAEQHPGRFAAVVASSPALWRSASSAADGAFDDEDDFARHDVLGQASRLDGALTRVDCGGDDVFADPTRDLLHAVPEMGGGIHAGYHDAATWRSFLPAQLDHIASNVDS